MIHRLCSEACLLQDVQYKLQHIRQVMLLVMHSRDVEPGDIHERCPGTISFGLLAVFTPNVLVVEGESLVTCRSLQHLDEPSVSLENILQLVLDSRQ